MRNLFIIMKFCVVAVTVLIISMDCTAKTGGSVNEFDCYSLLSWPGAVKIYKHIDVDDRIKEGAVIASADTMGTEKQLPKILSTKYHFRILESQKLYDSGKYKDAAAALDEAYTSEPRNPFILNEYARALYRFDGEKSFKVYKELISILDQEKEYSIRMVPYETTISDKNIAPEINELWEEIRKKRGNNVIIDMWFVESYWKLGTLYLDHGDYLNGAYEIIRSFYGRIDRYEVIKEQALGYVTEAMYYLKKNHLSLFYAGETLKVNPKNTYVLQYIEAIKSSKAD